MTYGGEEFWVVRKQCKPEEKNIPIGDLESMTYCYILMCVFVFQLGHLVYLHEKNSQPASQPMTRISRSIDKHVCVQTDGRQISREIEAGKKCS